MKGDADRARRSPIIDQTSAQVVRFNVCSVVGGPAARREERVAE